MDPELRRAWTEIVTADDYERHMAAIGQAQAGAQLMVWMIGAAALRDGDSITIAGAGAGQMLEFLDPAILRPHRLRFSDLNGRYLERLRGRLAVHHLAGEVVEDDFEQTGLAPAADLLAATLLLEHIDWRRGVEVFEALRPRVCGVVIQENPPEFASAVTPGRVLPPSIAKAVETAHPTLVPREEFVSAMRASGFELRACEEREVADGKKLVALLFGR